MAPSGVKLFALLAACAVCAVAQPCPPATPAPRGWNSWDADANPVNEDDIIAAATWMRDNLLHLGFDTITIDGGWYSNATGGGNIIDSYGLPVPDPARFPSSVGGVGLSALARRVNAMGLKLGAWTIRGLTPEAYAANLPIKGSSFHARDAGVVSVATACGWDAHTLGTNAPSAAADAWYESLAEHYVANGLSQVKIDCMYGSSADPSSAHDWWFLEEVQAFGRAFSSRAPQIGISWSPGDHSTPAAGAVIAAHAPAWGRMYRVTADFHDTNGIEGLITHLDTAAFFAPLIGVNGSFFDLDMLPLGRQAASHGGGSRPNLYSLDEQRLIMTLWAITRAPLILGAVLPPSPADDLLGLLGNAAILDVNARSCRNAPTVVLPSSRADQNVTGLYAWTASAAEGDATFVALFNVRGEAANVSAATGAPRACVRDVWTGAAAGVLDATGVLMRELPPGAAGMWRVGAC